MVLGGEEWPYCGQDIGLVHHFITYCTLSHTIWETECRVRVSSENNHVWPPPKKIKNKNDKEKPYSHLNLSEIIHYSSHTIYKSDFKIRFVNLLEKSKAELSRKLISVCLQFYEH